MGSALTIPKVGVLVPIKPDVIGVAENGARKMKISYDPSIDAWISVDLKGQGLVVWITNDYLPVHNMVKITSITKQGTGACGESLFISP